MLIAITRRNDWRSGNVIGHDFKYVPIRNLFIRPILEMSSVIFSIEHIIGTYFGEYGEVESVEVHYENTTLCGHKIYAFVQLKNAQDAKAILSKKFHRLLCLHYAPNRLVVQAAELQYQPDDGKTHPHTLLLTPPDRNSPDQILNKLNDDCLRVIFRYLNVIDLCNAADVCVCFNQNAKEAFDWKYKSLNLTEVSPINLKFNKNDIKSMLSKFGSSIQSFEVDSVLIESDDHLHCLCIIKDFCTQLKELKLSNFASDISKMFFIDVKSLFGRLDQLKLNINLSSRFIAPLMNTLADIEGPIQHLSITSSTKIDDAVIESISKVKRINTLQLRVTGGLTNRHLIELAKELPELEELFLFDCCFILIPKIAAIKIAVTHAKKLSILHLNANYDDSLQINVDDYKDMLVTVKNRPSNRKLQIQIPIGCKVNVPNTMQQENQNWLCFGGNAEYMN